MAENEVTVSSLMQHYQLQEEDCIKEISDAHLQKMSQSHCRKWRSLPPYLKMDGIIADDIDRALKEEDEKRFAFFKRWKEMRGSDANYRELIYALLEISCRHDAESACELLQKSLPVLAMKSVSSATPSLHGEDHEASELSIINSGTKFPKLLIIIPSVYYCVNELCLKILIIADNSPSLRSESESDSESDSDDVMDDVLQQLEENMDDITRHYASFVQCIKTCIKEKGVETSDLRSYLLNMNSFFRDDKQKPVLFSDLENELKVAENIDEIFMMISKYASFLNYDIFQSIIKDYEIDKNRDELKYVKHLKEYVNKHKLSEFIDINPKLKEFDKGKKIILKIDIETTCSITHIVDIRKSLARILGLKKSAVRIYDVKEGCIMVMLLIPTTTADVIFSSDKKFTTKEVKKFQALSILWLECNGRNFKFKEHNFHDQGKAMTTQSGNWNFSIQT